MTPDQGEANDALRRRAEAKLRPEGLDADSEVQSLEEANQLLHELHVHKVELEMQNDELLRIQRELQDARARYFDLYDLAPVGYCTVSEQGLIVQTNLTAATLLGVTRSAMVRRPLSRFILREDQDAYYQHRKLVAETGETQACELRMVSEDGATFWAHLASGPIGADDGIPVFRCVMSDVTERKRVEEDLRESEQRYRVLVDKSPFAISVHQDGKLVFVNWAAQSLLGAASADDLIGSPVSAVVQPDRREAARKRTASVFGGDTRQYRGEERFVRLDGSLVPVELSATPLTFGGRPAIQVIAIDITERKRAEDALRESEERFRAAFEQAAVGIAHVATDGLWLRVNQRLCEIVGYPREELLKKSFQEITHPGDLESTREGLRGLAAGEVETFAHETRYLRKDGSVVWVDLTASLVRSASGEPDYFISVTEDITARKQSEGTLQLQAAALGAAADAMVITDSEGAIEWVNPAFIALTGYSVEEAIGKNPRALLKSGVHDQGFYKGLWDTILAGKVWQGELVNRRKDGSLYTEEQSITPVPDAAGVVTHFVAIKRDVTERKRLEAEFLQAQKMEGVGQLAGGIAHDFNNLLNVITGTALIVSEQLRPGDPLLGDMLEITRAADRAAVLTRQLLAFSRKQIMQPKVLDLGTLVRDLEGLLQRLIGEDVELAVAIGRGPCTVMADPGQIEQVVLNLAVNARDAMPTGGTLALTVEAVDFADAHVEALPPLHVGQYVVLTVTDSGVGMDETTLAHMFEPFFTTKEPSQNNQDDATSSSRGTRA